MKKAKVYIENFSLYKPTDSYLLTPAYDLLSTALVLPTDTEELALSLNGKKRKIKRADFEAAMSASGLNPKVISNIFAKMLKSQPKLEAIISQSFLPEVMQRTYLHNISAMLQRISQ